MNLDALATVLTNAGLGTLGQDLFKHHIPDSVTEAIMFKEPLAGTPIDYYKPGFFKGPLQVIVRSSRNATGDAKAAAVSKALLIYDTSYYDVNGVFLMKINYLRPRSLPIVYPRTPGNSIEWSINFDACYVLDVSFS